MLVQQDAPQMVRVALRSAFPDLRVVSELPDSWASASAPVVTVISAGTPLSSVPWAREQVLVTAYAGEEPTARQIVAKVDAYLIDPVRPHGMLVTPAAGPDIVRDRDLGCFLGATTVQVATQRR
ncbi:hypothetical protein [Corynebacterium kalidii]|uniref:Uncharacterized protein n=1 Tax=Corynebacterium kalidii TaxID=2931982 RepID=A0A9X1WL02_9CORY|nr:hypothetical protein [Corynebacterium kalidii]MCJ7859270.1 hypothetical protein [Corynebacterium kalidii]